MKVDPAQVESSRRQLKTRQTSFARKSSEFLALRGVRPNAISIFGVVPAAAAGAALGVIGRHEGGTGLTVALLLVAVAGIQLRLLCNLLDGMVAMLGDKATASGEIFNDVPDRVSDLLIFIGAGYAIHSSAGPTLGWVAGMLAVLVAYVRVLGRSCGTPMRFLGPMAKQHRMAVLTAACLIAAVVAPWDDAGRVIELALVVVIVGCVVTLVRRLTWVHRDLKVIKS